MLQKGVEHSNFLYGWKKDFTTSRQLCRLYWNQAWGSRRGLHSEQTRAENHATLDYHQYMQPVINFPALAKTWPRFHLVPFARLVWSLFAMIFCAHHFVACTWLCIIFLPFWCMLDLLNLSHWSVHSIIGIPFIRVVFVFACGKGATTWRVMNKESQASNLNLLNFLSAC